MKVVVTGAKGQLGQDVMKQLQLLYVEAIGIGHDVLDITMEANVLAYFDRLKPDVIIHCAAYTNVDAAESDYDTAYRVNVLGTEYLAKAAKAADAIMLYLSTDYVFDGNGSEPYEVDHPTKPLGVYGETKFEGEEMVRKYVDKHFIVRTAWVFGIGGNNFVKTMIRLGEERGEVGVVQDQVGSPTYTVDLVSLMLAMMKTDKYGTYHATNAGTCSWYEFAEEIFKQAGMDQVTVNPLTTDQFPRPAKRPAYSVLSKRKLKDAGFTLLRDWKEALAAYLIERK